MDPERWRRLEQIYHSAAELDPKRREVFLVQACKGDQDLQDEIESLLAQAPFTAEFIHGLLGTPVGSLTDPCPSTLLPGQQLGPYRIEATLGSGGMGDVYRATIHVSVARLP